MIVVDASAAVELLLRTPRARAIEQHLFSAEETTLHAPHLLDVEVTQVLRRYYLHGVLSSRRANQALADLAALSVERYSHEPLLARAWRLRNNVTAYDAVYVALAEALNAILLTCDERLSRAAGLQADIRLPE